jgi:hypothetical protein
MKGNPFAHELVTGLWTKPGNYTRKKFFKERDRVLGKVVSLKFICCKNRETINTWGILYSTGELFTSFYFQNISIID